MKRMRYLLSAIVVALTFGGGIGVRAQSQITLLAPRPAQQTIDKIIANFQAKAELQGEGDLRKRQAHPAIRWRRGQTLDVNLLAAPFPGAIASGTIIPSSATPVASFLTAIAVPKGRPHLTSPRPPQF